MKKFDFVFDLQRFAGEDGGDPPAGGDNPPAGNEPPAGGGEGTPPAATNPPATNPQAPAGTILGGEKDPAAAGSPEAYDFKSIIPEGMQYDDQSAQAFSAIAKECGLSQDQAAKVAAYGMQYMQQGVHAAEEMRMQTMQSWGEQVKTELGGDYEKTVSKAATGIQALEKQIPGIRAALNETGAGNRIEFIRAFAALGELTSEDSFRGFGASAGAQSSRYPNTDFSKY